MLREINPLQIPLCLRNTHQWVLWKLVTRDGDKPTKVPFQISGEAASSTNPDHWSDFTLACNRHDRGGYSGIGFVFSNDDPYCGVDLDGCRDPETGKVSEWARKIILTFNTYGEVSPSRTGIKLFIVGRNGAGSGRKKNLEEPEVCGKSAAIEVYDRGRYFAMTGWKITGPSEPQERQDILDSFLKQHWPASPTQPAANFYAMPSIVERARKYVSKMPPSVSGQKGHDAAFKVACVLLLGFGLTPEDAIGVMSEWNQTCLPPWSERELMHKINSAGKQPGERNYLRNVAVEHWESVRVPKYSAPVSAHEARVTTLADATKKYVESLRKGTVELVELGLGDVDTAVGGGVERGELVIIAARPSHGKSAIALQCVHSWTKQNRPCLIISEEMSSLALGKRTLQFVSDVPQEHWQTSVAELEKDVEYYTTGRAPAIIAESCGSTTEAIRQIDDAVAKHNIQAAVVDYAQILRSTGKDRYEQITNTSIALKHIAGKHNLVVLLLCQLSREIEKRPRFVPAMSDIKETGQLEQDADVIIFSVWPHRIDSSKKPEEFLFFIGKNRNRPIMMPAVTCRFVPARQMICHPRVQEHKNYSPTLSNFNDAEGNSF